MDSWIIGKTVVITGASSGLGKELSKILINKFGCKVIGVGRNVNKLEDFKKSLGDKAELFIFRVFDVSFPENWIFFRDDMLDKGINPDILINCAGVLPEFRSFDKYTIKEVEDVLKTNFLSCVYSMETMLPLLRKSKSPTVVNVSSASALMTIGGTSVYTASKSALKVFTEAASAEYKGKMNISVVLPGFTKTEIFRNQVESDMDKVIDIVSTPCEKAAIEIIRGIITHKRTIITGKDARVMELFGKVAPNVSTDICMEALKKLKLKIFEKVLDI